MVWEKVGPAEASSEGERRVVGCVQRDDAVSEPSTAVPGTQIKVLTSV